MVWQHDSIKRCRRRWRRSKNDAGAPSIDVAISAGLGLAAYGSLGRGMLFSRNHPCRVAVATDHGDASDTGLKPRIADLSGSCH